MEATVPPFGMNGTKDETGRLCWEDCAGSGCGHVHPGLIQAFKDKDVSLDNPFSIPSIWSRILFKPPFRLPPDRESSYYQEALKSRMEVEYYPGDTAPSENWPGYRPGTKGVLNAVAPSYCNLSSFAQIPTKPPVLWIRGDSDHLISDQSHGCPGVLGREGFILNWPGEDVYPPQPMLKQIRYLLKTYEQNGGRYQEIVLENCGHAPHIEKETDFISAVTSFFETLTIKA